jgi:hypothetical protein
MRGVGARSRGLLCSTPGVAVIRVLVAGMCRCVAWRAAPIGWPAPGWFSVYHRDRGDHGAGGWWCPRGTRSRCRSASFWVIWSTPGVARTRCGAIGAIWQGSPPPRLGRRGGADHGRGVAGLAGVIGWRHLPDPRRGAAERHTGVRPIALDLRCCHRWPDTNAATPGLRSSPGRPDPTVADIFAASLTFIPREPLIFSPRCGASAKRALSHFA